MPPILAGVRVVAGTARGRRLVAPAGRDTRPTSDRVRESIFNALHSLGAVEEATVVDLFAGSGALGIEALSRGAAEATFVDSDPRAVAAIKRNLGAIGVDASVHRRDVLAFLASTDAERYDLVLFRVNFPSQTGSEVRLEAKAPRHRN